MKMTLNDYIKNPLGGSVMNAKNLYGNFYSEKFDKVLLRENGKTTYFLYTDDDKYIIHFKIPSEVIENFYYDVVLEFSPPNIAAKVLPTIDSYNVRFFSNDPAFIFTYAYVFYKNDLLIEDLLVKIGKTPLNEAPKEKNPKRILGYVKSFYFAYLTMKLRGLNKKIIFAANSRKYSKAAILNTVESASNKIEDRVSKGKSLDKKKRIERQAPKKDLSVKDKVVSKFTKLTKKTNTVPVVKKTKLTKRK